MFILPLTEGLGLFGFGEDDLKRQTNIQSET